MSKHTDEIECPSCEEKLESAHPTMRVWFKSYVKTRFPDAHISWAFRGQENQQKEFMEGRSHLPWPRSKHNAVDKENKPESKALDLFKLSRDGKAEFPREWYLEIANECEARGDAIRCGAVFKTLKDYCHFEME